MLNFLSAFYCSLKGSFFSTSERLLSTFHRNSIASSHYPCVSPHRFSNYLTGGRRERRRKHEASPQQHFTWRLLLISFEYACFVLQKVVQHFTSLYNNNRQNWRVSHATCGNLVTNLKSLYDGNWKMTYHLAVLFKFIYRLSPSRLHCVRKDGSSLDFWQK